MPERTHILYVPELQALAFSRLIRSIPLLLFADFASAAHACTVCDSPTAHRVRAGLFNAHFLHTFLLVAAPFPVFALLIGLLHFGMPDLYSDADLPTTIHDDASTSLVISGTFARAEPVA